MLFAVNTKNDNIKHGESDIQVIGMKINQETTQRDGLSLGWKRE